MLFFVIERFRLGDYPAVGERFRAKGRMMPAGVEFIASWITPDGTTCFQAMSAPDRAALDAWTANWVDLVDFEVHRVEHPPEFWARVMPPAG
ncbi:MAG: DUF3303 domain-containing protein [Phycisphaerales bacterium]